MIVVPEAKTFAEKVATTIQELNGTEAQSQ
jgi:hypothetical protein